MCKSMTSIPVSPCWKSESVQVPKIECRRHKPAKLQESELLTHWFPPQRITSMDSITHVHVMWFYPSVYVYSCIICIYLLYLYLHLFSFFFLFKLISFHLSETETGRWNSAPQDRCHQARKGQHHQDLNKLDNGRLESHGKSWHHNGMQDLQIWFVGCYIRGLCRFRNLRKIHLHWCIRIVPIV